MFAGGVAAEHKLVGDLLVALAFGEEAEDLTLANREAVGVHASAGGHLGEAG
ncbi:hypothetical protein D3C83_320140 [compost metagenome]